MSQHDHHHHHHHITQHNKKIFIWAASLTIIFAILEILFGFISGSLMIIGDGVHMSSDAISLILSLTAVVLSAKSATATKTFGYTRFEPIAAFINGLTLILIPIYIMYEAINRMITPINIIPNQMLIVGLIGLFINMLVGYILSKGESTLNMRSAMLHVIADMITSLSAVIVALAIIFFDWVWLDPIGSLITSLIIIRGGIAITKEAFHILMEGTPENCSVSDITNIIHSISPNTQIDDIKLWCTNEHNIYCMIRLQQTDENLSLLIKKQLLATYHIHSENIFIEST